MSGAKREGQGEGETTLNLSAPTQPTRLVKLVQRPRRIQLNHPRVPGPLPPTLTAPANKRLPLSAIRLKHETTDSVHFSRVLAPALPAGRVHFPNAASGVDPIGCELSTPNSALVSSCGLTKRGYLVRINP